MKTNKWNKLTACVLTSLIFASFSGSTALAALPKGYTKGTDGSYIYTSNVTSDISGKPGNKIVLGGGTTAMKAPKNVTGGYSDTGDVTESSVTVNQNVLLYRNNLYGGKAEGNGEVKASQNAITITSSNKEISTEEVIGGYAKLNKAADGKAAGEASNNTVTVRVNSASLMDNHTNLYGGRVDVDTDDSYKASADSNIVEAEGVAIRSLILGGAIYPSISSSGNRADISASNNTVIIKNSVFSDGNGVYGGYVRRYKNSGVQHVTVSGNTLTFDNSEFRVPDKRKSEHNLHGDMAAGLFFGTEGTVSDNTLTVNKLSATIIDSYVTFAGAEAIVDGSKADASLKITGNTARVTDTDVPSITARVTDTDVPSITGAYVSVSSAGNTSMTVTGNAAEGTNLKADLVAGAYVGHEEGVNTLKAAVDGNRVTLNQVSPRSEKKRSYRGRRCPFRGFRLSFPKYGRCYGRHGH